MRSLNCSHNIGEHVNTVQENLDLIQNMLASINSTGTYNFDMDSLMQVGKQLSVPEALGHSWRAQGARVCEELLQPPAQGFHW